MNHQWNRKGTTTTTAMAKRKTVVVENYQRDDSVRTDYPPVVVDPDNPLVGKLHDIRNRYREKKRLSD
jgi:hypothetical protein